LISLEECREYTRINKGKSEDANMQPVGLGNTRYLIDYSRNYPWILELFAKYLKEGQNNGCDPFFDKTFYLEIVSSSCVGAHFESWVKVLGLPFSYLSNLREFKDVE
jgi:hypothetical protein